MQSIAMDERVVIRFIKPWGHPTRNQICGTGEIYKVSSVTADILIKTGYAELVTKSLTN